MSVHMIDSEIGLHPHVDLLDIDGPHRLFFFRLESLRHHRVQIFSAEHIFYRQLPVYTETVTI